MTAPRATPLAPIDVAFHGPDAYSIEFLLRLPRPLDELRLASALEEARAVFWPVGGRLEPDAQAGFRLVECAEAIDLAIVPPRPALEARAPGELAAYHADIVSTPGEPLLRVRYGRVGEGAALVVHLSHCLVDGASYFSFLRALAAAYRGQLHQIPRPRWDRSPLIPEEHTLTPARHPGQVDAAVLFQETGISYGEARRLPRLAECRWRFLELSEARLASLQAEAAQRSDLRLSRHCVLAAHLWKVAAAEWGPRGEELRYVAGYDCRRVLPALSPEYFGNAVRNAALQLPCEEVLRAPLGRLAARVHQATAAVDAQRAWESLRCLAEVRRGAGLQAFTRMHAVDPRVGFLVTNLSKTPLAELDFGCGAPLDLVPMTPGPRTAFVMAARDGLLVRLPG